MKFLDECLMLVGKPAVETPTLSDESVVDVFDADKICKNPLVSVVVPIWNHERWLDKCIGSIVEQRTDFEFEILLCEDCSTDSSRVICMSWMNRNNDKVRLVSGKTNLGVWRNVELGYKLSRGKYIAVIEGDDYWINANKLQHQIDLMRFGDYRMVVAWNDISDVRTGATRVLSFKNVVEETFSKYSETYYHTSTYLFEKSLREELNPYFRFFKPYDSIFLLMALERCGRIGVLQEKVSVYRQTGHGMYTSLKTVDRARRAVFDECSFLRNCPKRLKPRARYNYQCALLDYVIQSNYNGRRSFRLVFAVFLALVHFSFVVNFRRTAFLWGSMAKSFICKRSARNVA